MTAVVGDDRLVRRGGGKARAQRDDGRKTWDFMATPVTVPRGSVRAKARCASGRFQRRASSSGADPVTQPCEESIGAPIAAFGRPRMHIARTEDEDVRGTGVAARASGMRPRTSRRRSVARARRYSRMCRGERHHSVEFRARGVRLVPLEAHHPECGLFGDSQIVLIRQPHNSLTLVVMHPALTAAGLFAAVVTVHRAVAPTDHTLPYPAFGPRGRGGDRGG